LKDDSLLIISGKVQ